MYNVSIIKNRTMKNEGFTLIELLIVVAIMGILGTVAVTAYIGVTKKAARSEAYSNLESLRLLEEQFFAENAVYALNAVCLTTTIRPDGTCFNPPNVLPGFRPGTGRSFDYAITQNFQLNNTGGNTTGNPPGSVASPVGTPCFVATATGILGSRVCPDAANCDMFAIDCNNNRNF